MRGAAPEFRWFFRSSPERPERSWELESRRSRLSAALRAGHGAGACFSVELATGADPSLALQVPDPRSARWVGRVLAQAYGPHQWQSAVSDPGEFRGVRARVARRLRSWPDGLRSLSDGMPILDATALTFRVLPAGATIRFDFEPIPARAPGWWETSPETPPSTVPTRPGRSPVPVRDAVVPVAVDRPAFWRARAALWVAPAAASPLLVARAGSALESSARSATGNGLRLVRPPSWPRGRGPSFELSELELSLTLPSTACVASGCSVNEPGRPDVRLPLGRSAEGSVIGPPMERTQGRHLAVLGETGMGKSSLLVSLTRRVARDSGVVFFDPLGDTARAVRRELEPRDRPRVLWIAPDGSARLNALAGIGGSPSSDAARSDRQLNDLVHSLRRVRSGRYADSGFWGPRLEEMLTRALLAAAAFPDGTISEAHLLLASGGRGFRTVPPSAVESVRELGDRIRSRPDDAEGARRLLYEVVRNPTLTRLLCEPAATVSASDLVAPGRLVLIAGDATVVGETTARYLLSVYLALVWSALLSRRTPAKTFVVLDEAQWFAHESLAEMLRLGRRLNVHVVLATQSISSLPEPVADAVWTNVADFVAFRGSPEEAREFARIAQGIAPEALLSLPRGVAAALLGKGHEVRWLRSARLPVERRAGPGPTEPDGEGPDSGGSALVTESRSEPPEGVRETLPLLAQAVRAAVEQECANAESGALVSVSLEELRNELDPSGQGVRALGSLFRRSGALVRSTRTDTGTRWWLDPARLKAERNAEPPATDAGPTQS